MPVDNGEAPAVGENAQLFGRLGRVEDTKPRGVAEGNPGAFHHRQQAQRAGTFVDDPGPGNLKRLA